MSKTEHQDVLKARFGASKFDNFVVIDTIGVPHSYCITPKHVVYASEHCSGMLDRDAIMQSEHHGAKCGMHGCTLPYDKHEQALLILCKAPMHISVKGREREVNKELHEYLLACKEKFTSATEFAGFAFKEAITRVSSGDHS